MKILIGAIALLIAAPAAAQAGQAADPHAGHTPQQHEQHKRQSGDQHGQHQQGHAEHKKDCCKDGKHGECCDKAKQGQKMACCAEHGEAKGGEHKGHAQH